MNRPCFSLGVLLASLAVCLLAIGSANGQTGIEIHTSPCLMCPYAEPSLAHQYHSVAARITPDPTESIPNDVESEVDVNDVDYDLDYESDHDSTDYENDSVDTSSEETADPRRDTSDEDDSEYDYSKYDYSDYEADYESVNGDANSEDSADQNADDSDEDDSDYDYSDYDDSDYDYSDYEGDYDSTSAETNAALNADVSGDFGDIDAEYDDSHYEGFYDTETTVAPTPVGAIPANEPAPSVKDEDDNFDYADYFIEAYGIAEETTEVESVDTSETESSVISNDDVEPYNYFDADAYGPTAPERDSSIDGTDVYDNYDGYESDYDLIEMIEEAQKDDVAIPTIDAVKPEAEDTSDVDNSLYDLRTTYDASYDEAMTTTTARTLVEYPDRGWGDHCFGGYSVPYLADYRCDLADQYQGEAYQSFYHDGPDPSVLNSNDDGAASNHSIMLELRTLSEPYVALAMERVVSVWQQISPLALVSRAAKEFAKLPQVLSSDAMKRHEETSISAYIDCHIDDPREDLKSCEADCFSPWETTQPVGSGLKKSDNSAEEVDASSVDADDRTVVEAAKASFRDLRSRMNAARLSPPLR